MKDTIYLKVCKYVRDTGIDEMLKDANAVAVGFSGGADSVFLLAFLDKYLKGQKLYACHLNHMIRGIEANRDNDFARDFCRARSIPFIEEKVDILAIAEKEKIGTEECARNIRYEFFCKCRNNIAAELHSEVAKVLFMTAHNADDNLETVIFNLARGSGTRGIGGISPIRDFYMRPLLCLASDEIRAYCKQNGLDYVTDSTNESDDYTRNLIRHNVSPILKQINPKAPQAVLVASHFAREDDRTLEKQAYSFVAENGYEPLAGKLCMLGAPIIARVLKIMYSEKSRTDISRANFKTATELICLCQNGSVTFPGGLNLIIGDRVYFSDEKPLKKKSEKYSFELKKSVFERTSDGFLIGFTDINDEIPSSEGNIYKPLIITSLNNDKIKGTLYARNRRDGDSYYIRGHHRKVKKLMSEKKIPAEVRESMPLVCDDDGIVWIPGFEPRDGVKDGEKSEMYLVYGRENGKSGGENNGH